MKISGEAGAVADLSVSGSALAHPLSEPERALALPEPRYEVPA